MHPRTTHVARRSSAKRSEAIAPTCHGSNFFEIDTSLRAVLPVYMDAPRRRSLEPHLTNLGELAGGRLTDLSMQCEHHPPVLRARDAFGRDNEWIEHHPAYAEMEQIAFGQFGMHASSHRDHVLPGLGRQPPISKYVFHYLFARAEFGLLCPVNLTDSSAELVHRFGSDEVRARYLDRMLTQDRAQLLQCAQFMTEKSGGSDAGSAELEAILDADQWRLYGEKWFCSNADADLAVLLARPTHAPPGGAGLGLFLVPKHLPDGSRNAYRIVRLKDKLGSRTMASGEIVFEGAIAYPLGDLRRGLKQMLVMVNSSRLSHLARAAGMMRRCVNEALVSATHRNAFGRAIIDFPLMRRQLIKLIVPTEQALSALLYAATSTEDVLRILTPIAKYRACRDNVRVATGAMEARGGNGYVEDWPNARLVRDAHLGLIWEGTSNINALDAIQRAVGKARAHVALRDDVMTQLDGAQAIPGQFRTRLVHAIDRVFAFASDVAASPEHAHLIRTAANQLYQATTAALLAREGAVLGAAGGDARRLLLARFVLEHRIDDGQPLASTAPSWEREAIDLLLDDQPVPLRKAVALTLQ